MHDNSTRRDIDPIVQLLTTMMVISRGGHLLDEDTPLARATIEFLTNNWIQAQSGLLAKTKKIEVHPESLPAPRVFNFQMFCPYKRKEFSEAPIELFPGPLRGKIYYRFDLLSPSDDAPAVVVAIEDRSFFHPNFSRRHGLLCIGHWPPGPIMLEDLLQHIYRIVTYQNLRVMHPADGEAATFFATDPDAMRGLEEVKPLY